MFTVMKVIAFNGFRGVAEDMLFGDTHQFSVTDFVDNDSFNLTEGTVVLLRPDGLLESANQSFVRVHDAYQPT